MVTAPQPARARCRWCHDGPDIIWCVTTAGKRIPIEADPNPAGNVELHLPDNPAAAPLAIVHAGPPGMFDDWTAYMPHHATCPGNTTPTTHDPKETP